MVYGRYNELVFMGVINQQTSLGGTITGDVMEIPRTKPPSRDR